MNETTSSYSKMNEATPPDVCAEEIHQLLELFSKSSYKAKVEQRGDAISDKCLKLFAKDYQFSIINNTSGELCGHYPSKLVILEYEKTSNVKERVESIYDMKKVREGMRQARLARCRSRFVVPVILYEGKHVCRSATLSSWAEMYSRSGLDFLMTGSDQNNGPNTSRSQSSDQGEMQMFDRVRGQDINLLKMFSVKYIVDLMVEKKKVKFGMNITSSEKVDKENRYGEFCIISVPYPGCEHFKEWKDNSYLGEVMKFDWSQGFVDACLDIPPTELLSQLSTDWTQYQCWNLVQLTQNYLSMLIHMLSQGDKGILVHCISGWDRTPLFVSLLRLTLWADGVIHKSLSATEILYLTLAYDWYLFGHQLSERLNKGEEIMLFCFYFLSYITSDDFSVHSKRSSKVKPDNSDNITTSHDIPQAELRQPHVASSGNFGARKRNSSSSSLSSSGSFTMEPQPHNSVFYLNCQDDNLLMNSCSPGRSGSQHGQRHSSSSVSEPYTSQPRVATSSGAVNIPSSSSRQPSMSQSPCGSWQVISNTGSLATSDAHNSQRSSYVSSCEEATGTTFTSTRWERLDNVRRIFYNAYNNKIMSKFKPETGKTNLLDQFAEKFGFKQPKPFF